MKKYYIEVHSCNALNTTDRLKFVDAPQESSTTWSGPRRDDTNYFMVLTDFAGPCFMFIGGTFVFINFETGFITETQRTAFLNCDLEQGTIIVQKCGETVYTNGKREFFPLFDAALDTKKKLGNEVYFVEHKKEEFFWAFQVNGVFVNKIHPDNHIFINGEKHYVYSQFNVEGTLPAEKTNFYHQVNGVWENWFYSQE